jgi:CspA family cold shock protein
MKGEIVRLVRDRGFGFIRTENGREIFFHATGLLGGSFETLAEGEAVEFEIEPDPRSNRERAVNVHLVGSEQAA